MSHGAGLVRTTCSSGGGPGAGAGQPGARPSEGLLDPVYPRTYSALLKVAQMVREARGAGPGSRGEARREGEPGGGAPGGWSRAEPAGASRRGRGGAGGLRRHSQVRGGLSFGKLGAPVPAPWNSAPTPPVLPRTQVSRVPSFFQPPLCGARPAFRQKPQAKVAFPLPSSSLGRAASNPSRGWKSRPGGALRRRNPSFSPSRPPLSSQPREPGCPALGAVSQRRGSPKFSVPWWGKGMGTLGGSCPGPLPSQVQGRVQVSGGRWNAEDRCGRSVLRSLCLSPPANRLEYPALYLLFLPMCAYLRKSLIYRLGVRGD